MGDKFENIKNSVIATRGSIAEGIINLQRQGHDDIAEAISRLEHIIANAPNDELSLEKKAEGTELLRVLADEAAKPTPSKSILKALGSGLWEVVKNTKSLIEGGKELWPIISKLWL